MFDLELLELFTVDSIYPMLSTGIMYGLIMIFTVGLLAYGLNFAIRLFKA